MLLISGRSNYLWKCYRTIFSKAMSTSFIRCSNETLTRAEVLAIYTTHMREKREVILFRHQHHYAYF